jgi:hypothetical protein
MNCSIISVTSYIILHVFNPISTVDFQKMNIQSVTVESGKLSAAARSAKLDEEVEKADEMFRMMGWKEGGTLSLLNQLLRCN